MKKIGIFLILVGILIPIIYIWSYKSMERRNNENVDDYINDTSKEIVEYKKVNTEKKENKNKNKINYTAILEIPSIKLKRGVVDSTKNFQSINYAISVDKSSTYPDKEGNLILYAHSGNSRIAFFRNLNKVKLDDDIYVYYKGIKYHYIIIDKYNFKKTGKAKVLRNEVGKYISIITCHPSRNNYQILVLGEFKDYELY